jgi:TolB protein
MQPTWSRDGRHLVATIIDPSSGATVVAVVDTSVWEVATSPASREYFFYSWNHDGTRLAALGPGESGGTSLDILDDSGALSSDVSLESSSIYVAWEPGGRRLLVHAGPHLWLMTDPDSPQEHTDYGPVGFGFQAPAWVPGTGDFLYVEYSAQPPEAGSDASEDVDAVEETITLSGPRLVRRSADNGQRSDLGDAEGLVLMSVHPDGGSAAISLVTAADGSVNAVDGAGGASGAQTDEASTEPVLTGGAVWIIDLDTGERAAVLDSTGFWLEWSHDGRSLLIATPTTSDPDGATLAWHVWDGQETVELTRFAPTTAFVRDYLRFADQYVETPRLWSPDSDAIVYGATSVGLDTTAVARLDGIGGVRNLGVADVSFWSPPPLDPASTEPG